MEIDFVLLTIALGRPTVAMVGQFDLLSLSPVRVTTFFKRFYFLFFIFFFAVVGSFSWSKSQ